MLAGILIYILFVMISPPSQIYTSEALAKEESHGFTRGSFTLSPEIC